MRIAGATATQGIRMYWRSAALAVLGGAVAAAVALPLFAAVGRLGLPDAAWYGTTWTPEARSIAETQRLAWHGLVAPVLAAAAGAIALAGITILVGSGARALQRGPEIAVRRAVGAPRGQLALAALLEGILLGGAALAGGGGIAWVAYRLTLEGWHTLLPASPATSVFVAIASLAVCFVVGALFVLIPARQRTVRVATGPPLELHLTAALLATGLVVVTAGGLLARQVARADAAPGPRGTIYRIDAGSLPEAERASALAELMRSLRGDQRVEVATITSPGLALGLGDVGGVTTDCGDCTEGNLRLSYRLTTAVRHLVGVDTFRALGARLIAGRDVALTDDATHGRVAWVNRALARRHFQHGLPLGRRIQLDGVPGWFTVVGIVDDAPAAGFGASTQPRFAIYLPAQQVPAPRIEVLVRGDREIPAALASFAQRTGITPVLVDEAALRTAQSEPLRWASRWLRVEGWAMWIIAALGALMLVRLWATALTPELGIRRAVGARRHHVVATLLGRVTLAGLGGIALALWFGPGAWNALERTIATLPAWDVALTLRNGVLLLVIALVSAAVPTWRAARSGPARLIDG